jgi:hypothetical protein
MKKILRYNDSINTIAEKHKDFNKIIKQYTLKKQLLKRKIWISSFSGLLILFLLVLKYVNFNKEALPKTIKKEIKPGKQTSLVTNDTLTSPKTEPDEIIVKQEEKGSNTEIKKQIKDKPTTTLNTKGVYVTLDPAHDLLFQNIPHKIKLSFSNNEFAYEVKLTHGKVQKTDSCYYITSTIVGTDSLIVYAKKGNLKKRVESIDFNVLKEPEPYLRDKPTNSSNAYFLIISGKLRGISEYKGRNLTLDVVSFDLMFYDTNDSLITYSIKGNMVPVALRKEIKEKKSGLKLFYKNIMIETMYGEIVKIKDYETYINVFD